MHILEQIKNFYLGQPKYNQQATEIFSKIENSEEHCPGCNKDCPKSNLRCRNGMLYFELRAKS